jgi:hypothetical protein
MDYTDEELRKARRTLEQGPHLLDDREREILRDAGYKHRLGDVPDEDDEIIMPTLQHFALPVWIAHVGLQDAELLGRFYSAFQALVMLDHQTDCLDARRHGKGGRFFAARVVDVAALAGISRRTAYDHTEKLPEIAAVDHQPGKKTGAWPHWYIDRDRMMKLYQYAAPALKPIMGGLRGQSLEDHDGRAIYGLHETRRKTLDYVTKTFMTEAGSDRVVRRDTIDPEQVREIMGIPEGFAK